MRYCIILILLASVWATAQVKKAPQKNSNTPVKNIQKPQVIKPIATLKKDTTQRVNLRIKSKEMIAYAHYPTGDVGLFTHIAHTLKYSENDIAQKTNGNVLVRFDVDIDSTIKEVRLIRDPCIDCGKALINIFQNLKFAPAITKTGTPMRSNMMLEIPVWAH